MHWDLQKNDGQLIPSGLFANPNLGMCVWSACVCMFVCLSACESAAVLNSGF